MATEHDCNFCGIVAGTVLSTTIAQTERAVAFMDINPVPPGHALVILRAHAVDLHEVTAPRQALFGCVRQFGVGDDGNSIRVDLGNHKRRGREPKTASRWRT